MHCLENAENVHVKESHVWPISSVGNTERISIKLYSRGLY